jgi:hypothetical protein
MVSCFPVFHFANYVKGAGRKISNAGREHNVNSRAPTNDYDIAMTEDKPAERPSIPGVDDEVIYRY